MSFRTPANIKRGLEAFAASEKITRLSAASVILEEWLRTYGWIEEDATKPIGPAPDAVAAMDAIKMDRYGRCRTYSAPVEENDGKPSRGGMGSPPSGRREIELPPWPAMKIATFNINDVNKRLGNVSAWLAQSAPDVVCLQELKCEQQRFPFDSFQAAGYGAAWRGQKSWNGVAILAKGADPIVTRTELPGDPADAQSRYIEAAVRGVLVASIYLPNGNPQPGPKFDYKLAWFERLRTHAASLMAANAPVVLAGDFNVAPTDLDIYPTRSWDNDALVQPASRAAFAQLLEQGWTDALRQRMPSERIYTFWSYKRDRWPRNGGLRLDHLLLSPEIAQRLAGAGVDSSVRGEENASDHAPAWIRLR